MRFTSRNVRVKIGWLLVALMSVAGWAQSPNPAIYGQSIPETEKSRAEREADLTVSLAPDKIIALLRKEPGLLLQIKKQLVIKAYEQGRILDSRDLTDEALYRLIDEDENVRILATREIEDRNYIQVRPNPEDDSRRQRQLLKQNRDDSWVADERVERQPAPLSNGPANPAAPAAAPDKRRDVERTQLPEAPADRFGGNPPDPGSMQRIQPDELPALLATSGRSGLSASGDSMADPRLAGGASAYPTLPMLPPGGYDPESYRESADVPQQTSHVDPNTRPQPPPFQGGSSENGQPAVRRRPNPYSDIPSLYDLYSQYTRRPAVLERFGMDIFRNGTGNLDQLPMDMPVGPEYVLGPGDGLNIDLWGGISQRLRRTVDREGRVTLPEAGAVQVSGRTLGDVQRLMQSVLRTQFRDVQADVSLSRLRTVRVYVVGDVERAGAYDVSSLSTPLNALYLAGGPTSRGSLRLLRHLRGNQLVQVIDVYDLLLHGVNANMERLQPGDTVLVPPLGPVVTLEGMVRRPAIYELNGEKSLSDVLELAGGVLRTGTLRHIDVERTQAHEGRGMLRVDLPETGSKDSVPQALESFAVQDGDKIRISPILPYAEKTVYLDGHVVRPGKYAYSEGMKVSDLIRSYSDLLPEPSQTHAEIIRLKPPDYAPEILSFNLGDALAGKDQNLALKPLDTVRVFGRFDLEDPPVISVSGEVRDPGDHVTNGATHLRDAIFAAGGVTHDALLDDTQVFRKSSDGKLQVLSVNLGKALAGSEADNILLEPKDRIFVHRNLAKADPPSVIIQGEVAKPGKYPLGDNLTAAGLVRLAGGFKRGAYTETADLTRYVVQEGKRVEGEQSTIEIARAMAGEPDTDVRLHDGDVVAIRQLAGWNDIGATITLKGEFVHPGTYGIRDGERLSSVIERAGGFRPSAYLYGTVFERQQVQKLEEKHRADMIQLVQSDGAELQLLPDSDEDQKLAKSAAMMQWKGAIEQLQNTPPTGRLVLHLSGAPKKWAGSSADIEVRAGDSLFVPKKPNFVMVDGAVYNPTAVAYRPGKSVRWYMSQAGGSSNRANKGAIFVVRADGSVVSDTSGSWFRGSVQNAALQPGDMIVIPEKAFSGTSKWRATLQAAQLVSAVGIAVQVARGF